MGKIVGLAMIKILSLSFFVSAMIYENYIVSLVVILVIDLTPSFIKEVWNHLKHSHKE